MSQREQNDLTAAGVLLFVLAFLACVGVWKFGEAFDLNFETSFRQIISLIIYSIFVGGCIYFSSVTSSRFLTLKVLLPIFIVGFYFSLSPAVGYRMQNDYSLLLSGGVYWWYAWYSKLGLVIIAAIVSWINLDKY